MTDSGTVLPPEDDMFEGDPRFAESAPVPGQGKARAEGFDRVPPQDLDAEQSALGGMLLSKDAINDVAEVLEPDDYYRPAHELIHRAIFDLHTKGEPADPITVAGELTKRGELQRVGGASYLHTLVNSVPTAANAEYYAQIVRERAVLRRLVEAGTRIAGMGYAAEGDVDEIAAAAVAEVIAVAEKRGRQDDFKAPSETLAKTLDLIQAAENQKGISGVPTGFADLDALTQGWQPGQVIVVAGRPGQGKSTLAMDFARACAMPRNKAGQPIVGAGRPAAFVTLEMSTDELNMRVLSAEGQVALHHLRSGGVTETEWASLATAYQRYTEASLYVNESARSLPQIQATCRRLKNRVPDLALIVIDYMQLIEVGSKSRIEVREQEIAKISRSIKLLAKELNLPIIVLAQLNRGPEMRADKKPAVSDLRESGSQEQDADIVILIHQQDKDSPRAGETDLVVGKHRNGPTPTISVAFQGHYSRFIDMTRDVT